MDGKKKRKIKNIISVVCVAGMFMLVYYCLKYVLVDDSSRRLRASMYQLYHMDRNVDVLFLGSSHCFCSLNPLITDEEFQAVTFNAGSSSQYMDGSLTLAKEAIKHHKIKQIYLEMYYPIAFSKLKKERSKENIDAVYQISDHMQMNMNRVVFLLQASSPDYYVNSFILPRRNWIKLFDRKYMSDTVSRKKTYEYRNHQWIPADQNNHRYYVDRGYYACDDSLSENNIWSSEGYETLDFDKLSEDWENDLYKLNELCKRNNINLTLFVAPSPEWTVLGKENYDEYDLLLRKISGELNAGYYNFEYCKPEYIDTSDPAIFRDAAGHLNTDGGTEFSHLFAKTVKGELDRKDVFYGSLKEKTSAEEPTVYALGGPYTNDEIPELQFAKIISNRGTMEYRITIVSEKEGEVLFQDFSANNKFSFPVDDSGEIRIEWRMPDDPDDVKTERFFYPAE